MAHGILDPLIFSDRKFLQTIWDSLLIIKIKEHDDDYKAIDMIPKLWINWNTQDQPLVYFDIYPK